MKSLRRRLVFFAILMFGWEALNCRGAHWSYVAVYELGLLTAFLFTFALPGRGSRWLG